MNSKVLITGASSGIGATYAKRLAARGHDLVLVARDQTRLDTLATSLRAAHGVKVEVLAADLGVATDLQRVEQALRQDTAIDTLINNAGMSLGRSFLDADVEAIEAMLRLNILAFTRLAAAAASAFATQGRSTLVNIGSVTALMAESFEPAYLASKAYVLAFTQALAAELTPRGVRVQVVQPGVTRTEIWERSGMDLHALPESMVMEVGDLVDAALVGLDQGELVTIPSLNDMADWDAFTAARLKLAPQLSLRLPAARYGLANQLAR